jgi:hypothetical protein
MRVLRGAMGLRGHRRFLVIVSLDLILLRLLSRLHFLSRFILAQTTGKYLP